MPRQTIVMSPVEWRAFLEEERTAVVSSAGRDGFPHLVAMWYVVEDDAILMWTYAKSQKAANLRRDPRVGVLIEAGERYEELRGVLIRAEAELIRDYDRVYQAGVALHARYAANYSEAEASTAEPGIRAQAAKRTLIRIPYTQVTSWDHRKLGSR
jgi:PPOX class probable F420-dependent enzyme